MLWGGRPDLYANADVDRIIRSRLTRESGSHVDIHTEPGPFGVKGLGPVDVADGHQYELEQEIAGTYREHRVSRAIGFGHGITITTRGSQERDGPEPYGLVVRLLT